MPAYGDYVLVVYDYERQQYPVITTIVYMYITTHMVDPYCYPWPYNVVSFIPGNRCHNEVLIPSVLTVVLCKQQIMRHWIPFMPLGVSTDNFIINGEFIQPRKSVYWILEKIIIHLYFDIIAFINSGFTLLFNVKPAMWNHCKKRSTSDGKPRM